MGGTTGSGAVRSSPVRGKVVRGVYGTRETLRFRPVTKVAITDCFVWVPEVQPKGTVRGVVCGAEAYVNAWSHTKIKVHGSVSSFYIITPMYLCNNYARVDTTGNIVHGHHSEHCAVTVKGTAEVRIIRVGWTKGSAVVDIDITKTAILFDGKPKMQLDEDCCVFT